MRLRTLMDVTVVWLGLGLVTSTQRVGAAPWPCPTKPVEPCFKHHGRLSSQNGIALKIWLIGTTRVVALDNDSDQLPPLIGKYLELTSPDHSYVYGDFDICPTEPDSPGQLRRVCLAAAEKLVVKPLRDSRPPFRLLSTWPPQLGDGENAVPKFP